MVYSILADSVVIVHLAFAGFVVFGFVMILLGKSFGWSWTRRRDFRITHMVSIAFVAIEAMLGVACPLTILENQLRVAAGQVCYQQPFIGHLADRLLFYEAPEWVFTAIYVLLAVAAFLAYLFFPPFQDREESTNQPPN